MRFLILFLAFSFSVKAQLDSAITVPLLGINFGGQLPGGDMAQRFGPNLKAGGSLMLKTKKNWIIGVDAGYMFGRNVREDVLSQLKTPTGYVIDNDGFPADLRITQRGFAMNLVFGRVFKFLSTNPNSGLMITVGGGYLQHKINLYDAQQRVAAVREELRYGYDRLTNGFALSQFIGYLFLSENRLTNFYAGFETTQGMTRSIRKLNYDTGLPDTKQRLDLLYGFRLGWILPLYKKRPNDFYYY